VREPTEMELRVAKVLYDDLCSDPDNTIPEGYAIELAQAAIRAMREPTSGMLEAEAKLYVGNGAYAGNTWHAMIDSASPPD